MYIIFIVVDGIEVTERERANKNVVTHNRGRL